MGFGWITFFFLELWPLCRDIPVAPAHLSLVCFFIPLVVIISRGNKRNQMFCQIFTIIFPFVPISKQGHHDRDSAH